MASLTFAETTKKRISPLTTFAPPPSEEQGIIFQHVEDTKIRDYLMAIYGLIGGPQNIVAASRVSGGRIIIFLASIDIVNRFQSEHGGFQLGNLSIKTKKLKTPAIKVIISNVSPTIPNSVLETYLTTTYGLQLVSPIAVLRVSPSDDIFSHVISWRRQVYIHPNTDKTKIPTSFQLTYAERSYRIFLTTDSLLCFKCNSKGHKAEDCSKIIGDDEVEDSVTGNGDSVSTATNLYDQFPSLQNPTTQPPTKPIEPPSFPSTNSTSLNSHKNSDQKIETPKKAKKRKRQKTGPENFLKDLILTEEEKKAITDSVSLLRETKRPDCDFSANNLITFLPTVRGVNSKSKSVLINSFTKHIPNLLYTLEEIKPQMKPTTKRTIAALIKTIDQSIDQTILPTEEDSSDLESITSET